MLRRTLQQSTVIRSLRRIRQGLVTSTTESRIAGPVVTRLRAHRSGSEPATAGKVSDEGDPASPVTTQRRRFAAVRSLGRGSRLLAGVATLGSAFGAATRHSRLTTGAAGTLRRFVHGSWLYRWLTAEPDPDVIVIDLRETLTVGPWLVAIERGLRWLLPATASSALVGLGRGGHRVIASRPIQVGSLLVGLLAVALLAAVTATGDPSAPVVLAALFLALIALLGSRVTWSWAELRETRGYQALAAAFEPPEPPERIEGDPVRRESADGTSDERKSADEASDAGGDSVASPPESSAETEHVTGQDSEGS